MAKRFYLAYGSNLNVRQMKLRCPDAKIVGKAEIADYQLLFKGSKTGAYLTIEKAPGAKVPVAVWEVSKNDESNLDRYEGFPNFYYKKDFKIKCGRKSLNCFAYIMHEDRKHGIPTGLYMRTCLTGYKFFDFDKEFLFEAVDRSMGGMKK